MGATITVIGSEWISLDNSLCGRLIEEVHGIYIGMIMTIIRR